MTCPGWCENPDTDEHTDHWTRAAVADLVLIGWVTNDGAEVAVDIGETAEAVLTMSQARELRSQLDQAIANLEGQTADVRDLDFETPCGHASCHYPADFGVWVSHHASQCRPDTGFRCADHADELQCHWRDGLGGEMQCGCRVDGALEDHFRLVAL